MVQTKPPAQILPPPSITATSTRSGGSAGKGSRYNMSYGTRKIKAYPVSEEDLQVLFWMGLSATFSFAMAAGFLGFAFDIQKDLTLGVSAPEAAVAFWKAVRCFSFLLAALSALVGGLLVYFGKNKISKIKHETTFN